MNQVQAVVQTLDFFEGLARTRLLRSIEAH